MSSEGMDIPSLNTLVLASPKTDVEQSAGRIFRQKQSERLHVPLIIDIVDQISIFKRQSQHRRRLYNRNKYQIIKKFFQTNLKVNRILPKIDFSTCLLEDPD